MLTITSGVAYVRVSEIGVPDVVEGDLERVTGRAPTVEETTKGVEDRGRREDDDEGAHGEAQDEGENRDDD